MAEARMNPASPASGRWRWMRFVIPFTAIAALAVFLLLLHWTSGRHVSAWLVVGLLAGFGATLLLLRATRIPIREHLVHAAGLYAVGFILVSTAGLFLVTQGLDCGQATYASASWDQPGMYQGVTSQPGATRISVAAGLPFAGQGPAPEATLTTLDFAPPRNETVEGNFITLAPGVDHLSLNAAQLVTATADNRTSPEQVRQAFRDFVANLTAADKAQVDAWADSFLASRQPTGIVQELRVNGEWVEDPIFAYQVQVKGAQATPVWNRIAPGMGLSHEIGVRAASGANWQFTFALPVAKLTLANQTVLTVDSLDAVRIEAPQPFPTPEALVQQIRSDLTTQGLPASGLTAAAAESGPIC